MQVCETLDRRRGMTESTMWLAEPPLQEQEEAAEGAEEAIPGPVNPWAELPVAEQLSDVLQRLRIEYSYCIFCGCQVRSNDVGSSVVTFMVASSKISMKAWCGDK